VWHAHRILRPVRVVRSVAASAATMLTVAAAAAGQDEMKPVRLAFRSSRGVRQLARAIPVNSPWRPVAEALEARHVGDDARLTKAIEAAAAHGSPHARRRLIALLISFDSLDNADRLLTTLDESDPAAPRLRALLAAGVGDLDAAREAVLASPSPGPSLELRRRKRLHRAVAGELRVQDVVVSPGKGHASVSRRSSTSSTLHVVTNSLPHVAAGYAVRTQRIAEAQRAAGMDARVVTQLGFPATRGRIARHDVEFVNEVPYHRLLSLTGVPGTADRRHGAGVRQLGRLVDRLRPEVLHAASNYHNGQLALAVGRARGIPVVYEVRGFLEDSWLSRQDGDVQVAREGLRYRRARESETRCMRDADAVVTLGQLMADEIIARGIEPDKVTVVPNAVPDEYLGPLPDGRHLRARLGIEPGEVVVGTMTTFYAHEGLPVLVRAAAELSRRGHPVRLLLVGDGPELPVVRRLAQDLGLGSSVLLPGRVPFEAVRGYYAAMDVFATPRIDARVTQLVTPLKPVEAMACGLPVVASEVGGLSELVEHDVTGLLVAPDDPRSLADALQVLATRPEKRSAVGYAARAAVAEGRTWSANAGRYRTLYDSLLRTPV
jgi:glycosyltransferase involved in cell wall biosynthesis